MSQNFHPISTAIQSHVTATPAPGGQLDVVMVFGAAAVVAMFFCKSHQDRMPRMVIGTIVFGFAAGVYGFIVGAWPLGVAEIVYTTLAYRQWLQSHRRGPRRRRPSTEHRVISEFSQESRLSRLFGPM